MKKAVILVMLVAMVSSCKKTWQCECREVQNWQDWNPIVTNVAIEKEKKDNAEAKCKSLNFDLGNGNYKNCSLK